jgi:UDP-N-acetyl-D-mannosaminuronate dehydrogenase
MRREAFDLIQRLLNKQGRGTYGSSILFFGVSYKKDVGDIRESAAIKMMKKLYEGGARISFWDPVRAKHPAKPPVKVFFTDEEYKALPENAKKDSPKKSKDSPEETEQGGLHLRPKELTGDWESLKKNVLSSKYSCVVIATDHADFHKTYADLVRSNRPPIADLCNAINWWVPKSRLSKSQKEEIRERLNQRKKYMLIGLH